MNLLAIRGCIKGGLVAWNKGLIRGCDAHPSGRPKEGQGIADIDRPL